MAIHLKPFDPGREFVTQTAFRANGILWGTGYRFDKASVNSRTLMLLYTQRKIIFDDDPRAIKLLSRNGGKGEAPRAVPARNPGDQDDHGGDGREDGPSPTPAGTEDELVKRLMGRHNHAELVELAKNIPGVQKRMTKKELSTALVRSGHGAS